MVYLKEYGRRYIDAALNFCDLIKCKNNGVFPTDLMTLSDDVIGDVVFDTVLCDNNLDLQIFVFLKFSMFESFSKHKAFFENVFRLNNPDDNCFFLFCLLRHMNSILCGFSCDIDSSILCSPFGEKVVLERMKKENRQSLLFILDNNFDYVFSSSLLYIDGMSNEDKREIVEYFEFLIFQNGFDFLLFLSFLDSMSFYELGLGIDFMFNKLPKKSGYQKKV